MIQITSSANPQFRLWKSLLSSKGLKKEGLLLLSGEKLVREALRDQHLQIQAEILDTRTEPITGLRQVFRLPQDLFDELDELGTHFPLLLVKAPLIPDWDPHSLTQGLEVFCPLGDPQNLGALLRSAEAFGVRKVVLLEEAAHPFLPKSIKAASGSCLRLKLEKGPSLTDLKGKFTVLDLKGQALPTYQWPRTVRLLIGEEGPGLKKLGTSVAQEMLCIPMAAGVESLNAGVASSIALFHYRLQYPRSILSSSGS